MNKAVRIIASVVLAIAVIAGAVPMRTFAADAADVPSGWATSFVTSAIDAGYVPESLQQKYTDTITRQEFCELVVQFYEAFTRKPIVSTEYFFDTKNESVLKAASVGIVSGTGDGNFTPDSKLTREQAAAILCNLAESLGQPLKAADPSFADNGKMSGWAVSFVGKVQAAGLMSGKSNNNFDPKGPYTREQSITTIMNARDQLVRAFDGVESISFETAELTIGVEAEYINPMTVVMSGKPAEDVLGIAFKSSDEKVATVAADGTVTTVGIGDVTVTAAAANGVSASYKLCVVEPVGNLVIKTPVTLNVKLLSNTMAKNASLTEEITTWKGETSVIINKVEATGWNSYRVYVDLPFLTDRTIPNYVLRYNLYDKNHEYLKTENIIREFTVGKTNEIFISPSVSIFGDDRYFPFIIEFVEE